MKEIDWLKNPMEEDMGKKLLSTLCTNSLALSGFSFTSLAVFLGFYKDTLQQVSGTMQYLTVASVLFFMSSEIAREAHTVGEYLLSETIYLLSSVVLLITFIGFVLQNLLSFGSAVLWVMVLAAILFVLKLGYSIWLLVKRINSESRST
jgi:hypothetical protein